MITLRAHHVLCMRNFIGHGYSRAFVENMENVMFLLRSNPEVLVVMSEDDICAACPNNGKNGCADCLKVVNMDKKVLRELGLPAQTVIVWDELKRVANDRIPIDCKKLSDICGDCQWIHLCK